jgi:hypothetical protein
MQKTTTTKPFSPKQVGIVPNSVQKSYMENFVAFTQYKYSITSNCNPMLRKQKDGTKA